MTSFPSPSLLQLFTARYIPYTSASNTDMPVVRHQPRPNASAGITIAAAVARVGWSIVDHLQRCSSSPQKNSFCGETYMQLPKQQEQPPHPRSGDLCSVEVFELIVATCSLRETSLLSLVTRLTGTAATCRLCKFAWVGYHRSLLLARLIQLIAVIHASFLHGLFYRVSNL